MKIKKRIYRSMVGTINHLRKRNDLLVSFLKQANHRYWVLEKQKEKQRDIINNQRDIIGSLEAANRALKGKIARSMWAQTRG